MIIDNNLKSNKKVLITEKRRSNIKTALEVQQLPNKPFRFYHCAHYAKNHDFSFSLSWHIFKTLEKLNKFLFILYYFKLVLSFPEFDVTHWMSHWKWFNNSLSGIHSQFLKKCMQTLPLMKVYISGSITTRRLTIIWNQSLKLSSENFCIEIFFYNDLFLQNA